MTYTYSQLRKIQDNLEAVKGRRYEQDNGDIYEGLANRRLKLLGNAYSTATQPVEGLHGNQVQEVIEELNTNSKPTQVLVDFGEDLYQEDKMFTIIDSRAIEDSTIIASKAIKNVGLRSKDEVFAETLEVSAQAGRGVIYLYIKSLCGSVSGQFYINYSI
jgi:hypothetical protein